MSPAPPLQRAALGKGRSRPGERVALVPIEDIRDNGFDIRVARFPGERRRLLRHVFGWRQQLGGSPDEEGQYALAAADSGARPDLTRLSCRWNPIPASHGKVLTVIAVPGPSQDMPAFPPAGHRSRRSRRAGQHTRHPLPEDGPKLGFVGEGLGLEARAGAAHQDLWGRTRRAMRVLARAFSSTSSGSPNCRSGRFKRRQLPAFGRQQHGFPKIR